MTTLRSEEYFENVAAAIQKARQAQTGTSPDVLKGYSGTKLIALLQALSKSLLSNADVCYLEVGVFQGLTLLSVANHLNADRSDELLCFGVDNFSQFDVERKNYDLVTRTAAGLGLTNVRLINRDYEDAFVHLREHIENRKLGVYFVDGPHDYRSQLMCLLLAVPYMASQSVILVDDCNYPHVRLATRDFLVTHPEFKLAFEAYTPGHPMNAQEAVQIEYRNGWWNGVHVLVRDVDDLLASIMPEVGDARQVCENEHILQSDQYSRALVAGLPVLRATRTMGLMGRMIDRGRPWLAKAKQGGLLGLLRAVGEFRRAALPVIADHVSGNTFSSSLPEVRMNPSLERVVTKC